MAENVQFWYEFQNLFKQFSGKVLNILNKNNCVIT